MSQYLEFFVRHNEDFIPLASYSRNTHVYDVAGAPYEKIRRFSQERLESIASKLREIQTFKHKEIARLQQEIEIVKGIIITVDNFDDLLGAIHNITNMISEYQEDIETLEREAIEIEFMRNMTYDDCEIFAGIEISDPTMDDIC